VFIKKTVVKPPLQALIDDVARQMLPLEATDPEFAKMNEQMKVLCASQSLKKEDRISADTKLVVAGNLLGIVLILAYEHAHVITSKALNFVFKSRV
jgi:hypothetical protein